MFMKGLKNHLQKNSSKPLARTGTSEPHQPAMPCSATSCEHAIMHSLLASQWHIRKQIICLWGSMVGSADTSSDLSQDDINLEGMGRWLLSNASVFKGSAHKNNVSYISSVQGVHHLSWNKQWEKIMDFCMLSFSNLCLFCHSTSNLQ